MILISFIMNNIQIFTWVLSFIIITGSVNATELNVKVKTILDYKCPNGQGVRFLVSKLNMSGLMNKKIHFGMQVAQNAQWLKDTWVGFPPQVVKFDPAYWKSLGHFCFPYKLLQDAGADKGTPFVASFFVMDTDANKVLGRKDIGFSMKALVNFVKGARVSCNWKNKGKWYPGKVAKVKGKKIYIKYDDGDKETTTHSSCVALDSGSSAGETMVTVNVQGPQAYEDYKKKKKNLKIWERAQYAIKIMQLLGNIGDIKFAAPVPPTADGKKKQAEAKTKMETVEKQVYTQAKATAQQEKASGKAAIEKSGQQEAASAEKQLTTETQTTKKTATAQAKAQTEKEETQVVKQQEQKLTQEEKKAEQEIEKETVESEGKIEKEINAGKNAGGLCATCKKAVEKLDQMSRQQLEKAAQFAKDEAKKRIEAAAAAVKEQTTGVLDKKAEALKATIKGKVEAQANALSAQTQAKINATAKAGVTAAVGKMPADLKPYAAQYQEPVIEKIELKAQEEVDGVFNEASGRIVNFADSKIDGVMAKVTGPINDKIDAEAEKVIKAAHEKIDKAKALVLAELDKKKADALKRIDKACKGKASQAKNDVNFKLVYLKKDSFYGYLKLHRTDPSGKFTGCEMEYKDSARWIRDGYAKCTDTIKVSIKSTAITWRAKLTGNKVTQYSNEVVVPKR